MLAVKLVSPAPSIIGFSSLRLSAFVTLSYKIAGARAEFDKTLGNETVTLVSHTIKGYTCFSAEATCVQFTVVHCSTLTIIHIHTSLLNFLLLAD